MTTGTEIESRSKTSATPSFPLVSDRFAILPRVLPMAIYLAFMILGSLLDGVQGHRINSAWLYAVKISAVALCLLLLRHHYKELTSPGHVRKRDFLLAVGMGVIVFVFWINLNSGWMVLGVGSNFNPVVAGKPDGLLIAIRLFGAALVVPVMEELFWRSFLLRWLEHSQFESVYPGNVSIRSFVVVCLMFGFEHSLWLAGVIAGAVYGALYMYRRNLWLPVVSHATTNLMLGIFVIYSARWEFW